MLRQKWLRQWRAAVAVTGVLVLVGCAETPLEFETPSDTAPLSPRQPIPSWTPTGPTSFTVVAGGDVLIHPALVDQAVADGGGERDFSQLLDAVEPVIAGADLAICHLEAPLGGPDGPFSGYPRFNVPPEIATALADAGYDQCSTASNHTMDAGPEGVRSTLDTLDEAGIGHTGSARSAEEAAKPAIIDLDGIKVGHVSYTFTVNTGTEVPADSPWMVNLLDVEAVLAAAREAKEAGAEVVIASLHWGGEYTAEPIPQQEQLAAQLLGDPAVDLILGHHAHVVQPFERIGTKWVAYGLGNHLARHANPLGTTEEGVIGQFRFAKSGDGKWVVDHVGYVPTLIDLAPPIRVHNLADEPANERNKQATDRLDQVLRSRGAVLGQVS